MIHTEYATITQLGAEFDMSCVVMGRKLKQLGLREPGGHPSVIAFTREMVRKMQGREPWIVVWVWHAAKTIAYLERAGLERIDHAPA